MAKLNPIKQNNICFLYIFVRLFIKYKNLQNTCSNLRVFFFALHTNKIVNIGGAMWEYSINFSFKNEKIALGFFDKIKKDVLKFNGLTVYAKQDEIIKIVLAVDKQHQPETEIIILKAVGDLICNFFKSTFLNKYLFLPNQDEMSVLAFKKALINFDKETDYFLVSKHFSFKENLFVESFYQFKLVQLREKWQELVRLANDNREYLVSADAFNDLLKFLIDNLDICKDEIDVIEDDNEHYYICEKGKKGEKLESLDLVTSLIDMSPQKINFYYKNENHAINLLKTIFDRRLNLKYTSNQTLNEYVNVTVITK